MNSYRAVKKRQKNYISQSTLGYAAVVEVVRDTRVKYIFLEWKTYRYFVAYTVVENVQRTFDDSEE